LRRRGVGELQLELGGATRRVVFEYPRVRWRCIGCGMCCRDLPGRERRVLLLPQDIERIEAAGHRGFYQPAEEPPFTGIISKKHGVCVFHSDQGCEVYPHRPLLCRLYPFWVEVREGVYVVGFDETCPGRGEAELGEEFFARLLGDALRSVGPPAVNQA